MTHYEERLEHDLGKIRAQVGAIGEAVEKALRQAVHALLTARRDLAAETILGDLAINRAVRALDHDCHSFVARHLPSAGHLRFVSAVLRMSLALERIGDYAVTVSRETVQLSSLPPSGVARDIELLAEQSLRMLHQAMDAFAAGSAELARGTRTMGEQVESTFTKVFADLLAEGESGAQPIRDLFALLVVFNRLGRVADQAKNLCEETVFAATGATKEPKVYRILFADAANDGLSLMAEAIALKAYPGSGRYQSAGWQPATAMDPLVAAFLEQHGYETRDLRPRPLETSHDVLASYHVLVGLGGDLRSRLPELPFHTVLLEWDLGGIPSGAAALEEVYKRLAYEIRRLMETLRGPEAA